jgi:hypothetical protein
MLIITILFLCKRFDLIERLKLKHTFRNSPKIVAVLATVSR